MMGGVIMQGHARIYEYNNTHWNQLGSDIDGEDAGDNLGTDIAIAENGHTVIVGLKDCDNDNDGCAKVYNWDGTTWNQHGQNYFWCFSYYNVWILCSYLRICKCYCNRRLWTKFCQCV